MVFKLIQKLCSSSRLLHGAQTSPCFVSSAFVSYLCVLPGNVLETNSWGFFILRFISPQVLDLRQSLMAATLKTNTLGWVRLLWSLLSLQSFVIVCKLLLRQCFFSSFRHDGAPQLITRQHGHICKLWSDQSLICKVSSRRHVLC